MRNFKSNNNIVFDCKYHIVWCTKYRRKLITPQVEKRLKEIISEVAKERRAEIIEIEANRDHVHFLVSVDPQYGIHRLVKQMKGRSLQISQTRVLTPDIKGPYIVDKFILLHNSGRSALGCNQAIY